MPKARPPGCVGRAWPCARGRRSDGADVRGLRTLLALLDVELDALVLLQRAIARRLNGGEVDEDVGVPTVGGDEAVALLAVEPLHGALCHWCVSFVRSGCGSAADPLSATGLP